MSKEEIKTESKFGQGLTYCLGLFLCHTERNRRYSDELINTDMWFNGSSDHLYELIIPEAYPQELRERLGTFRSKCLSWGHGFEEPNATKEDKAWAINEAKELLLLIDRCLLIDAIQATWA